MKMIKNMGKVSFYGKMGESILEFGKMENNMVLESITLMIINFVQENGQMVKGLDGMKKTKQMNLKIKEFSMISGINEDDYNL